ncbi:MAG: hypothetical protein EOP13_15275 [Pseudomonas sp.]|uniref:hypothetical protein n=1 Tax=Pseudomonas sp. TaxID=306 RepID=UPI0012223CEA|nr:hypothetical protein [Pseudomonas sp.]RZI72374.1 MAG: hypothetical protein EOP13_15275 [Pseudomonas sp.]
MIGNPYATPLPGFPDYQKKPTASGMPTQYQDTFPKHYEDGGTGLGGGDKYPLPGGMPDGTPGMAPATPPAPQPYAGMPDLDWMLQRRKANDQHRQMLAQLLAGQQQQQPQGPAPYANQSGPVNLPPPIAEASPWSIVAAAFNGLAEGYKKSKAAGELTEEGANVWWGSNGGMKS